MNKNNIADRIPFTKRHIGPSAAEQKEMLDLLGINSLEKFIDQVVPQNIRAAKDAFPDTFTNLHSEEQALAILAEMADKNKVFKSFIGLGYYGTVTPTVIKRNILENPLWYTQYTPYQAEISQGRLEALLNYQTLITELCALPVANASLLDEGTAAAEAMGMALAAFNNKPEDGSRAVFHVDQNVFPQTIALLKTRAWPLNIEVRVEELSGISFAKNSFGLFLQYPAADGSLPAISEKISEAKGQGIKVILASDPLALMLLKSPGELGADIAVGSSQRFGVPLGFGGPHAAFMACKDEFKRLMPGRIIGVSKDTQGNNALRLSLQTREQHIRREKATSNICTAQVLLAVMASMYAVYHGPKGLKDIASRVHVKALSLAQYLKSAGFKLLSDSFFDSIAVQVSAAQLKEIASRSLDKKINLGHFLVSGSDYIRVALDETTTEEDLHDLCFIFTGKCDQIKSYDQSSIPAQWRRESSMLNHKVFNSYHSETEFLRYVNRLQSKDLSLAVSMIPLGSCTMKLNATSELLPVSWEKFAAIHPFAPAEQVQGYKQLFSELENYLRQITGFSAVSLQPNSGAQGEYAGLLAIKAYHQSRNDNQRNICLIPKSAHGTNAASAAMAGFEVMPISCDDNGNVDLQDLKLKCAEHGGKVAALMVTYPSTHGVFEEAIKEACAAVHATGAQVYMDGANLNALVGLVRPIDIGADVCHINLHKTFSIPHGGGGPGVGPIAVARHLANFLPGHPLAEIEGAEIVGPVCAAPWGSASILPISLIYIKLMGIEGLRQSSQIAILNANYIARRLSDHYPVLYVGKSGFVAHECIIDLRAIEKSSAVKVEDVAKRLMDYGFHAPTISWPVPGTMMIEPTESESKAELDRFCEAMISIRQEISAIESGQMDKNDNPLKNAPHTAQMVIRDQWQHSYSRELAAYPAAWTREFKFWPAVGRVDNAYGDRNFICSCS